MAGEETSDFSYQELASEVCPEFQKDFLIVANKGNASTRYLIHIDSCEKCQSAIEKALRQMSAALEGISCCLEPNTD